MPKTLDYYLGKPVSLMLADSLFRQWSCDQSSEDDLPERVLQYVFPQHGLELQCDANGLIGTIFLSAEVVTSLDEALLDVPFSFTRQQVRDRLGPPSKSGGPLNDPILGAYGAWDRFTRTAHTVHVEYQLHADHIKKLTLMRPDMVP